MRALGHDMRANFMLLESSFGRLKSVLAKPADGEVGELVAHVEACLRQSKRFLDDMGDLARTGSLTMEPNRVDPAEVVGEVLFEQRELLAKRGVQVDVPPPSAAVSCNRQRLKQVITNLVRNAAIHGCDRQRPKVAISIALARPAQGDSPAMVAIRVHDNGPGIDPAHADEIFLPGRRLAGRSPKGSGMGLAIVRQIVEHYGGTVRVDPQSESGTAIELTLPGAGSAHPLAKPHWELPKGSEEPARQLGTESPHSDVPMRMGPARARRRNGR